MTSTALDKSVSPYSRFVYGDVVHFGRRVDTKDGTAVYLLCEKNKVLAFMYGGAVRSHLHAPGVDVFDVFDNVDCMACLVAEAR